jgi:predicted transcriptional regulator
MKTKRPKTTPMMVRIEDELEGRLRAAAKKMGSNKSAVFRFALLNELPRIEGGHITIAAGVTQ